MFASSRNHDPSSFAQALRQRRPRQRTPRRPGSAGPSSKSIPGPSSIPPSGAPATAVLGATTPASNPPNEAASSVNLLSKAGLSASGATAKIPTSPPHSPSGLPDLSSQAWTMRSLRLAHPATSPKRRASYGADTPADGSALSATYLPIKRARTSEPGAEGARTSTGMAGPGGPSAFTSSSAKEYSCGLCSRLVGDQPRQQCQTCPDIHYCLRCSINSAVLHPGHAFEMVEPLSITTSAPRQQEDDNHKRLVPSQSSIYGDGTSTRSQPYPSQGRISDEGSAEADDKADEHVPEQTLGGFDDEEPRLMLRTVIRIPYCKACRTRLFDLRYECQDCPDTNFCSSCRLLQSGHTLKVVTSPFIVSNPDSPGDGGAGAGEASIIQDGANEDGDVSASPGSDSGGQEEEDATVDRVNAEYLSDDHDSIDVDERADGGIGNIRSSKQCRPIGSQSKPRKPPVTQPEVSHQDLSQVARTMAKAIKRMQAVVHATEHIMRMSPIQDVTQRRVQKTHDRRRNRSKTSAEIKLPKALLDFPIDFATLDSDSDGDPCDEEEVEEENNDEAGDKGSGGSGGGGGSDSGSDDSGSSGSGTSGKRNPRRQRRSGHRLRQWSSRERRRLAQLKHKGWKDGRIGADLGRSASAVAQQWRKQKLSAR